MESFPIVLVTTLTLSKLAVKIFNRIFRPSYSFSKALRTNVLHVCA